MNPNLFLVAFGSMSFNAAQIVWIDFAAFTDITDGTGNIIRRNAPCVEVKLSNDPNSWRLVEADRDEAMIWKASARHLNNISILATFATKAFNLTAVRQINANGLNDQGQECYEIVLNDPTEGVTVWKLTGSDAEEAEAFFVGQAQARRDFITSPAGA